METVTLIRDNLHNLVYYYNSEHNALHKVQVLDDYTLNSMLVYDYNKDSLDCLLKSTNVYRNEKDYLDNNKMARYTDDISTLSDKESMLLLDIIHNMRTFPDPQGLLEQFYSWFFKSIIESKDGNKDIEMLYYALKDNPSRLRN